MTVIWFYGIMKIGLPAAIFATAGHPEIIKMGDNLRIFSTDKQVVLFFANFKGKLIKLFCWDVTILPTCGLLVPL